MANKYEEATMIKVIQYGVGVLGKAVAQILGNKVGIKIVGALDVDKEKLGRDIGEIAGLGKPLGVLVSDNPERLFMETKADMAIHTVTSKFEDAYPQIAQAIEHGLDVVTSAEEFCNPFALDHERSARLQNLAVENGATVLGTGVRPGFLGDYLTLAVTGVCAKIEKIESWTHLDLRPALVSPEVAKHFGVGLTHDEFAKKVNDGIVTGPTGMPQQIELVADRLGWKLDEVRTIFDPIVAEDGIVSGYKMVAEGVIDLRTRIVIEHRGSVNPQEQSSEGVKIVGWPDVNIVISPGITGIEATAARCVNVIPHVLKAKPGIMTPADLPLVWALADHVGPEGA